MPREIRSLTGLRGVAAVIVMAGHYHENIASSGLIGLLFEHSANAVDLFFVLSGFVLAMVYADGIGGPGQLRRYMLHRVARLYPLYALTTLACFAMARLGLELYGDPAHSVAALVSNLALTQEWGWPIDSLNGPGWSISAEWAASLLFPLLVPLLLRGPWRWAALSVAAAAAAITWCDLTPLPDYWTMPVLFQFGRFRLSTPILACIAEFMLGMLAWRMRAELPGLRRLGHSWVILAILAAIFGWMLTPVPNMAFAVLAAGLVIALSHERPLLAQILALRPMAWLGRISFALYLVHAPLITAVLPLAGVLDRAGVAHAWTAASATMMAAALALATLAHHTIERPAQTWLRRRFAAPPPSAAARTGYPPATGRTAGPR